MRASYDVVREAYADRRRSYNDPDVTVDEEGWKREAGAVLTHLGARRYEYLQSKSVEDVDWALQDARVVLQASEPQ